MFFFFSHRMITTSWRKLKCSSKMKYCVCLKVQLPRIRSLYRDFWQWLFSSLSLSHGVCKLVFNPILSVLSDKRNMCMTLTFLLVSILPVTIVIYSMFSNLYDDFINVWKVWKGIKWLFINYFLERLSKYTMLEKVPAAILAAHGCQGPSGPPGNDGSPGPPGEPGPPGPQGRS